MSSHAARASSSPRSPCTVAAAYAPRLRLPARGRPARSHPSRNRSARRDRLGPVARRAPCHDEQPRGRQMALLAVEGQVPEAFGQSSWRLAGRQRR